MARPDNLDGVARGEDWLLHGTDCQEYALFVQELEARIANDFTLDAQHKLRERAKELEARIEKELADHYKIESGCTCGCEWPCETVKNLRGEGD